MFADRLKELRKQRGITQYQFAQKFNIATGTIGMWEGGKREPNFETVSKIADYFNVSVDYLLGRVAGNQNFDTDELDLIEKYRHLDARGKENVQNVIDLEYIRRQELRPEVTYIRSAAADTGENIQTVVAGDPLQDLDDFDRAQDPRRTPKKD